MKSQQRTKGKLMANQNLKKIGVTGGKGGVGKSTFAILLAKHLAEQGEKTILCDCDVECPNDYLLLGQKLKKHQATAYAEFPKLIKSKCKKCGLCAKSCYNNAIFAPVGHYPIFIKDLCSGCGACQAVCPFGAIKMRKEETGKIYLHKVKIPARFAETPARRARFGEATNPKTNPQNKKLSKIKDFYLITGVAKAGLAETGPIVAQTKKFALNFAKKIKADILLFDTAAGTHCPVIHALMDSDIAYLVTEPTPMGEHDLRLILKLCKKLRLQTQIILNQSNLGKKENIERLARTFQARIAKEIPFSKALFQAYSNGQLLNFRTNILSNFSLSPLL